MHPRFLIVLSFLSSSKGWISSKRLIFAKWFFILVYRITCSFRVYHKESLFLWTYRWSNQFDRFESFWFFRSNRFKAGLKRTWEAQLVGIFTYPKWDSLVPNTVIYRRHCHNEPSAFVKLRKMNFFFFFINLVKITFSRLDEYKNIAIVSFLEKKNALSLRAQKIQNAIFNLTNGNKKKIKIYHIRNDA